VCRRREIIYGKKKIKTMSSKVVRPGRKDMRLPKPEAARGDGEESCERGVVETRVHARSAPLHL
jgi:hypothetical protein